MTISYVRLALINEEKNTVVLTISRSGHKDYIIKQWRSCFIINSLQKYLL